MEANEIEQIARDEWEKLGAFTDEEGKLKSHWEFFQKGIELALSKYQFTKEEMLYSFQQGANTVKQFYKWMDNDLEIAYTEGHSNSMRRELGKIDRVHYHQKNG